VENPTPGLTDLGAADKKSPERIERDMAQTRDALTEKVALLENQVLGNIQSVTDGVTEAVDAVKDAVTAAPGAVSDTVKQTVEAVKDSVRSIDVTGCIRRNPWSALGTSAMGGFLLGYFLGGGRRESRPAMVVAPPAVTPQPSRPSEPGVFDELIGMMSKEAKQLVKDVITSTSAALKQNISTGVPKLVDAAADRLQPEPVGSGI